ncbi:3'-5' exonuclease [Virgibacillus sp. W0181]|uniref:3'-5' exonuclease n=1 Tax=Virgibacillus sp. W0181 TaxID=3391581 RepID=UPI003F473879
MLLKKRRICCEMNDAIPLSTPLEEISFTVFDTETTGFQVNKQDRLIEIAAVNIERLNVKEETFHSYVQPHRQVPEEINELTGICDQMLENAPNSDKAIKQFLQFVEANNSSALVGHFVMFDKLVLKEDISKQGYRFVPPKMIDTLDLIGYLIPSWNIQDLEHCAVNFGTKVYNRHTALGDALTTAYLFCELVRQFCERGYKTWNDLLFACDYGNRIYG